MNVQNILCKDNIDKVSSLLKEVYQYHILLYTEAQKWKKLYKSKSEENNKLWIQIASLKSVSNLRKENMLQDYTNSNININCINCPENNYSTLMKHIGQLNETTSVNPKDNIDISVYLSDKNKFSNNFLNSNNVDDSNIESCNNLSAMNSVINPVNSLPTISSENINESFKNLIFSEISDHEILDNNIFNSLNLHKLNYNNVHKSSSPKIKKNKLTNKKFEHKTVVLKKNIFEKQIGINFDDFAEPLFSEPLVPQTQVCEMEQLQVEIPTGSALIVPETIEIEDFSSQIINLADYNCNNHCQTNNNSSETNNTFSSKKINTNNACNNLLNQNNLTTLNISNDSHQNSQEIDSNNKKVLNIKNKNLVRLYKLRNNKKASHFDISPIRSSHNSVLLTPYISSRLVPKKSNVKETNISNTIKTISINHENNIVSNSLNNDQIVDITNQETSYKCNDSGNTINNFLITKNYIDDSSKDFVEQKAPISFNNKNTLNPQIYENVIGQSEFKKMKSTNDAIPSTNNLNFSLNNDESFHLDKTIITPNISPRIKEKVLDTSLNNTYNEIIGFFGESFIKNSYDNRNFNNDEKLFVKSVSDKENELCKERIFETKNDDNSYNAYIDLDETYDPKAVTKILDQNTEKYNLNTAKEKRKNEADYAYVDVIRKKNERQQLLSIPCEQCNAWFESMGISEVERMERIKHCRHKFKFEPSSTPEQYWTIGFPDTQQCKDKGYMAEGKTKPSKFRRRKQLRKMF